MPRASAPRFHPGVRVETRTLPRAGGKRYAILWLGSEPVNSMTLELWTALSENLTALESDPNVSGVVFASELKKPIFTAGNDINELYAPKTSRERYAQFWRVQTSFLCRLLRSPLATVCAIRGACPAGGCAVSLCCDYRVQSETGTFGLNEVQLGIPVPKYWAKLFVSTAVDAPSAELALHRGTLLTPIEARALGLINEICPHAALVAAAERTGDAAETSGRREGGDEAQHTGGLLQGVGGVHRRGGEGRMGDAVPRRGGGRTRGGDRQTVVAEQKDGRWRTRKGGGRGETVRESFERWVEARTREWAGSK